MELKICHLYPDVLNLYGDGGNIVCIKKRLEWRGIESCVTKLPIGSSASLAGFDLVFIGGGQDFEQEVLLADLHRGKAESIRDAVNDGVTFLTICGGYQMMGEYYETHNGVRCDFIGAVDMHTIGSKLRMTGDYKFKCGAESGGSIAVGFENHSGKTYLGKGVSPLGTVLAGFGNNGEDGTEGVRYKNLFGTYSHGPLLPKNPELCDAILLTALKRKYGSAELAPIDDAAELAAHDVMMQRIGR